MDPTRSWIRGATWAKPLKLEDKVKMRGGGQNISHFSSFFMRESKWERKRIQVSF